MVSNTIEKIVYIVGFGNVGFSLRAVFFDNFKLIG
jgi:hypothetical protein